MSRFPRRLDFWILVPDTRRCRWDELSGISRLQFAFEVDSGIAVTAHPFGTLVEREPVKVGLVPISSTKQSPLVSRGGTLLVIDEVAGNAAPVTQQARSDDPR